MIDLDDVKEIMGLDLINNIVKFNIKEGRPLTYLDYNDIISSFSTHCESKRLEHKVSVNITEDLFGTFFNLYCGEFIVEVQMDSKASRVSALEGLKHYVDLFYLGGVRVFEGEKELIGADQDNRSPMMNLNINGKNLISHVLSDQDILDLTK